MNILNKQACIVEDRRVPTSVGKPSYAITMTCEDCGQEFLIIVAGADTTNFRSVCAPCWDKRPTLSVCKPMGDRRDIKVAPNEDLDALLQRYADKESYQWASFRDGDAVRTWYFRDGKAVEKISQESTTLG